MVCSPYSGAFFSLPWSLAHGVAESTLLLLLLILVAPPVALYEISVINWTDCCMHASTATAMMGGSIYSLSPFQMS